ncbi:MAG: hypothetical protein LBN18_06400 [Dysgonamonadaceae bacterium]|jgi:hypothetical protein|nr:hypothetical protein [Dysgonamonadaceae bacterium]
MTILKYFIWLLVIFLTESLLAGDFTLQTGDLLFQLGKSSGLNDAIAEVTANKDSIAYTHVGIVFVENDSVFVIEATIPEVCQTPVDSFLYQSAKIDGRPIVMVARLKPEYRKLIPQAVENARKKIGKPYDYVYDPDNEAYYCSELIYLSFCDEEGKPIFPSLQMTFRDAAGYFPEYWIKHFKKYQAEIPEGREGTNPAELAKSDVLELVYRYFSR